MKIICYLVVMISLLFSGSAFAQNASPSMMILPDFTWCKKNGYVIEDRISKAEVPDYTRAFHENTELKKILTSMYNLYSAQGVTFSNSEFAHQQFITSLSNGELNIDSSNMELNGNSLEYFLNQVDIVVYLNYSLNINGPKKSLYFTLSGFNVSTGNQLIDVISSSAPTINLEIQPLIDDAVSKSVESFNTQIQRYYDDIKINGRSSVVTFRISKSSSLNFNKMFNNKALREIIESWFKENLLNVKLTNNVSESKTMNFTEVRFPIIDTISKKSIKASLFIRPLQKILETAPYNISTKGYYFRNGKVILYLSEKQ